MSMGPPSGRRSVSPRVLLLDINPPGWAMVRAELCEALMNVLSLAASTSPRGDLLSMYTARETAHCLLPLLLPIRAVLDLWGGLSGPADPLLSLAVLDALQQNRQLAQHSAYGGGAHNSFVEVLVLSTRPGQDLASELDEGLKESDLSTLRRLLVVQLSCDVEDGGSNEATPDPTRHPDHGSHIYDIELRVSSGDVLSLESFFKAWLFESEREEVRLIFPKGDIQIICDVHRPLLPPSLLLGGLPHDGEQERTPGAPQTLRILRALSSQGVCGSMLYGLPSILNPTACWELDWDQLESNQENFQALCHCLQSRAMSLLGCSSQRSVTWAPPVLSHFIVSASDSMSLLLRPLAPRELLLLIKPPTLTGPVPDDALNRVQDALGGLQEDSLYNPLQISSNLYKQLQVTLSRPAPPPRPVTPAFRGGRGQSRQGSSSGGKARATIAPLPFVSPLPCKRGQHREKNSPSKIRFLHDDEN
ncbi:meiosis 1 arrest protein isoform X2 [Lithobates pipiens]